MTSVSKARRIVLYTMAYGLRYLKYVQWQCRNRDTVCKTSARGQDPTTQIGQAAGGRR